MIRKLSSRWNRGYSMVEALVVAGLIAAITLVALPMLYRMFEDYKVQSAAQQMTINLRFCRNAAVKQKILYQAIFNDQSSGTSPNTYQILYDQDKNGTVASTEIYRRADVALPTGLLILTGGTTSVIFDARGSATVVGASTVQLKGKNGTIYRLTLSPTGAVTTKKL